MTPSTTPMHTFTLPLTPPAGTQFRIVYAQGEPYKEIILFEKTTKECEIDGNKLKVQLKADETLRIDCTPKWSGGKYEPFPVLIQIGMATPDGSVTWSDIIEEKPDRLLKTDGVV